MGAFDDLIPGGPASAPAPGAKAGAFDDLIPKRPGLWERAKDAVTGHLRTEFPDAPEFLQAAIAAGNMTPEDIAANREPTWTPDALMRSNITSDPKAALDILREAIPGLQAKQDKHGNLMLKTPHMGEWAYLNKPGISSRDIDELGTQFLATLPFMGAGAGKTVAQRAVSGATGMAVGEGVRQTLEQAAGSEQGYKGKDIALAGGLGALAAPGVATTLVSGAKDVADKALNPTRELVRGLRDPGAIADKKITEAFVGGTQPRTLGPMAPNAAERPVAGSADELKNRATALLDDPANTGMQGMAGPIANETVLGDIGGERTRDLARWAANVNGDARQSMQNVVQPRFEGQSDRIMGALRELGGNSPTARMTSESLERVRAQRAKNQYSLAFSDGADGVWTQRLALMYEESPTLKKAAIEARDRMLDMNAAGLVRTDIHAANGKPTLEMWDQMKRVIDGYVKKAERYGDTQEVARLTSLRNTMRDELDAAIPTYKGARSTAERYFDAEDALDAGQKFASPRGAYQNEKAREAIDKMNQFDRDMFERGFIDRTLAEIHEKGINRDVVAKFRTPAMQERLEIALGPDKAEKFATMLEAERTVDFLRGAFGNSTTARQLAQMMGQGALASGIGGLGGALYSQDPMGALVGALTGMAVRKGAANMGRQLDMKVAEEVAKRLMSRDVEVYARGIKMLQSNPTMRDNLLKFGEQIPTMARNLGVEAIARDARND
ncbi:MAG: hypothetical protein KA472_11440 [Pseudomonadales bacterium]|nr:hypothetical protein [Pseudomonadales bacterium]